MNSKYNFTLFGGLSFGSGVLNKIKEKVVVITGLPRTGKSTVFNWILGRFMIGRDQQAQTQYELLVQQQNGCAEIGNDFLTTLIPNTFDIDISTTLVDMPSYFNQRGNYIKVISSSIYYKDLLQNASKYKFIIVIDECKILSFMADGIVQTFQSFFALFNMQLMSNEAFRMLLSSITLIITKITKKEKIRNYLRRVYQNLKQYINFNHKEIILKLIDQLITSNRVHYFPIAQTNINSPDCTIIQLLNNHGWEYFDINSAKKQINDGHLVAQLSSQYNKLPKYQLFIFHQKLEQKIHAFLDGTRLILCAIMAIKDRLQLLSLEKDLISSCQLSKSFQLGLHLKSICEFLSQNDLYGLEEQLLEKFEAKMDSNFNFALQMLRLSNIFEIANKIMSFQSSSIQTFKQISICTAETIDCLPNLSCNTVQYQLKRFKKVLTQNFNQFLQLQKIGIRNISNLNQQLKDMWTQYILCCSKKEFIFIFIKLFAIKDTFDNFLKTYQQIIGFEALFQYYIVQLEREYNYCHQNQQKIIVCQIKLNLTHFKVTFYLQKGQILTSLSKSLQIYFIYDEIQEFYSTWIQSQAELQEKLDIHHMLKFKTIRQIVSLLLMLDSDQYLQAKQIALRLANAIQDVSCVCDIFEILALEKEHKRQQLKDILRMYSEYCFKYGRIEKGIEVLQQKLSVCQSYNQYYETKLKLKQILKKGPNKYIILQQNQEAWMLKQANIHNYLSLIQKTIISQ